METEKEITETRENTKKPSKEIHSDNENQSGKTKISKGKSISPILIFILLLVWWKKEPSRRTFGNREGWTQQVKSEDLFEDIPETKVEENSIEDDQQELIQRLEKFYKRKSTKL